MPFETVRQNSPANPAQRSYTLAEELAEAVATHCAAIGDDPRDFIAEAIVLALEEAEALRLRFGDRL